MPRGLGGAVDDARHLPPLPVAGLARGYGFDGVIIAILARNQPPLLVPLAAVFLAYLRVGADVMAMYADVSAEMVSIIQAVIILLVTAEASLPATDTA